MTISTAETDQGIIEYSLYGQGKAILIVHGGHVDCHEAIFAKGLDLNKYLILTPSRPGYGNTPLTETNKTPKGAADIYITLLDKLKVSKATVIGISAGGLTALEIAANYPGRVENLILMSALTKKWFGQTDKTYRVGKIFFKPGMERFTWMLYKALFMCAPQFMASVMFKSLSKHRPVHFTRNEFLELKQMTMKMSSGRGFCNDLDQDINQNILQKIDCPTLVLHSDNDNQVSGSHALNAENKIKNSKLVTFNNRWGHMLWFGDEYHLVLRELKSFL